MSNNASATTSTFNRPFYLDRCLLSIQKFVSGEYKVEVLDDGTPEPYLAKINAKYPDVVIRKSKQYPHKVEAIKENLKTGKEINGFKIPTNLWIQAVKEAEDYVLVTEDDVWFTDHINLQQLVNEMKTHRIALTKLGWLGNSSDDKNLKIDAVSPHLDRIFPEKLFTANQFVMDLFIYNKYKFFSLLYKLGKVDNYTIRKYWVLNSISMGLYHKEYWLHIWKDAQGKVDEKQQLRNAATWYHRNKMNKNAICRTRREYLKTTFQSSASGSYHQNNLDFDVNYFNHLINEAWYLGKFDVMQNFPQDFSLDYFIKFCDEKVNVKAYKVWIG